MKKALKGLLDIVTFFAAFISIYVFTMMIAQKLPMEEWSEIIPIALIPAILMTNLLHKFIAK